MGISGNLLNLMESFLPERYQRVLLHGQSFEWASIKAGVPQGSILDPFPFSVYINDLNSHFQKVSEWTFKWKMSFNPDPTKQAQEVIFSGKLIMSIDLLIGLNNLPVQNSLSQKHLGLILDEKLNFEYHLKDIGIIKKLQNRLPRQALLTIYI